MARPRSNSKLRYESPWAVKLHFLTCQFISGKARFEDVQFFVKDMLESEEGREALDCVSESGHTHLYDALHLSHTDMCSSKTLGRQKALKLLTMYAELASQSALEKYPDIFKTLLLHRVQNGLSPLHQLIMNNHAASLAIYLQIIRRAFLSLCVKAYEIVTIFEGADYNDGNSAIHLAMKLGNKDTLKVLAEFLATSFKDKEKAVTVAKVLSNFKNKMDESAASLYPDLVQELITHIDKVLSTPANGMHRFFQTPELVSEPVAKCESSIGQYKS